MTRLALSGAFLLMWAVIGSYVAFKNMDGVSLFTTGLIGFSVGMWFCVLLLEILSKREK